MKKLFAGIFATVLGLGCLTACGETKVTYNVDGAAEFLDLKYTEELNDGRVDYEVMSTIAYQGVTYEIEWSVDAPETAVKVVKGETTTKIDVNEAMAEDLDYVLTATVKAKNGKTATVSFPLTLLKAKALIPVDITEKPVAGTAYKLYVYNNDSKVDCYFNGKIQSNYYLGSVEDYEEATNVYVEYVEGSDTLFNLYFNDEVAGEETKQYFGIRQNWNATKGYWAYNPYIEDAPVSQFEYSTEYKTIITTVPASSVEEEGAAIDTTKVIYWGNSGSKYTTIGGLKISDLGKEGFVANLVTLESAAGKTADEKIAFEKDALQFATSLRGGDKVDLAVIGKRYPDVKISWKADNALVAIDDDEMTIGEVTAATSVKVTVTFTIGETTDTKEFTVELKPAIVLPEANATLTIEEANALGVQFESNTYSEDRYYVSGKIKSIANPTYGNLYIEDENGNTFYVYGLYDSEGNIRYDAMETKPAVGDTITVYASIGNYNGTAQMKNARMTAYTAGEGAPEAPKFETAADILNALYALADGEQIDSEFTLTGKITALDSYNNPTIVVEGFEDKPVYCYRLSVTNAIGDVITVKATSMKNYKGTYEFMNCTLVTDSEGGEEGGDEPLTTSTIATIIANKGQTCQAEGTVVALYARGFILQDSTGMILVYKPTTSDAKLGDKVTVVGTSGSFNGGAQFGEGCVVTVKESGTAPAVTAEALTGAQCDELLALTTVEIKYVSITGTLEISSDNKYYNVTLDGATTAVGSIAYPSEEIATAAAALNGKEIVVEGYFFSISKASGSPKFINILATSVVEVSTEGGEITPPEGGEGGEDTHEHSYVNGTCACGEADPNYVAPEVPESAQTVTVVVADYASENSWVNETNYSEMILNDYLTASVEGTAVGSYSLNTGKLYGGNNWRIYQSENATLTISADEGVTIFSVTVTYNNKNTGVLLYKGVQIASATAVGGINSNAITFNVGATDASKTNGQVQITAIEVVFVGGEVTPPEGGDTPVDPQPHEHNFVEGKCECGEVDPEYKPEEDEPVSQIAILEAAYALAKDETLANQTLTGVIVKINDAYSSQYSNITVTILVEDITDMPMLCYRIKGAGADTIKVGDTITVTGTIKNYNGTIEFDTGSALTAVDTEAAVSDITKVYTEALALEVPNAVKEAGEVVLATTGETYADVAISWAADNDCVAINGGTLTFTLPQAAATVTVTATVVCGEVTETYTFAVTVSAAPSADTLTAGFVASQLGLANSAVFSSKTVDNITFTAAKNSGSTQPAYYTSGNALRLYSKNTFTISCDAGYKIVSIAITTETGKNGINDTTCTITNATATGLGTASVLLTPVDGTAAVVMTNPASSGNFRIVEISVTYVPVLEGN